MKMMLSWQQVPTHNCEGEVKLKKQAVLSASVSRLRFHLRSKRFRTGVKVCHAALCLFFFNFNTHKKSLL